MAIWMWDELKLPIEIKVVILVYICSMAILVDWGLADILWAFFFYIYKDDEKKKWISFCIIAFFESMIFVLGEAHEYFQFGVFLVPILFLFYNGESGSKGAFHKWFFYVFYPAHLLIIFYIAWQMGCYK